MPLYFTVLGCFFSGYLLKIILQQKPLFVQKVIRYINVFIIWVALPALILSTVPGLQFSLEHIFPLFVPWFLMLLGAVLSYLLAKKFRWSRELVVAIIILIGLGNTAFLGVPIIEYLMDEKALLSAIVYDQLGSFIMLSVIATSLIAAVGSNSEKLSYIFVMKKIMQFPPFLSLVAALFLPVAFFTETVLDILGTFSVFLLPLAMLVIGLQFSFRIEKEFFLPVSVVLVSKMIVAPLFIFLLGQAFMLPEHIIKPSILQSAMPPMVTAAVLLVSSNVAPRFAATTLGIGTLLACFTLPLTVWLVL